MHMQANWAHLEVLAVETLGELLEERKHDFLKLGRLRELQYLLQFPEEQHLLLAVCHGPVLEQRLQHWLRELGVLLNELQAAGGQ